MNTLAVRITKFLLAGFALAASLASAGEVVEVSIEKMQFVPQLVKIKPGTTVNWVNHEKRNNHSILFEKEGLPESDGFSRGNPGSALLTSRVFIPTFAALILK